MAPRSAPTLLVCSSEALGGAERILLDAAERIDGVVLAAPPGPLAEAARASGVEVAAIPPQPLALRASLAARGRAAAALARHGDALRELVRARQPGAVVAWSLRPALAAVPALAGLRPRPALVIQHNDFLPGPAIAAAARAASRRADRVTAPSRAVAAAIDPRGRLGARLRVVAPGTDLDRFATEPLPVAAPPRVLVLGALVPWKCPDLALETAALAAPSLPGLRLTVAGPALGAAAEALLARLRDRAARPDLDGVVDLRPGTHDAAALLRECTCLLHCAEREPFGMALVEAMAAGRPVVAPAAAGPAEIVDAGVGRTYPPGDAAAAAAALVDVLEQPGEAAALGRLGRARAEGRYGADAWAERLSAVIDEARAARG